MTTEGYHTDEAKPVIRVKVRRRKRTPEQRAQMSASAKRRWRDRGVTPETCARISAAQRGKIIPAATKAKMSAAHTGKRLSQEHRDKLSAIHQTLAAARRLLKLKVKLLDAMMSLLIEQGLDEQQARTAALQAIYTSPFA